MENVHQDKLIEFITGRSVNTSEVNFCSVLRVFQKGQGCILENACGSRMGNEFENTEDKGN